MVRFAFVRLLKCNGLVGEDRSSTSRETKEETFPGKEKKEEEAKNGTRLQATRLGSIVAA